MTWKALLAPASSRALSRIAGGQHLDISEPHFVRKAKLVHPVAREERCCCSEGLSAPPLQRPRVLKDRPSLRQEWEAMGPVRPNGRKLLCMFQRGTAGPCPFSLPFCSDEVDSLFCTSSGCDMPASPWAQRQWSQRIVD